MSSYFVGIGNTDDRLGQSKWASFIDEVNREIVEYATQVHFTGYSDPTRWWQNCGWMFDIEDAYKVDPLYDALRKLAKKYNQDSIAILQGETEFLAGVKAGEEA
jgi:hypothetical protein